MSRYSEHIVVAKALADQGDEDRKDPVRYDKVRLRLELSSAQNQRLTEAVSRTKMTKQRFISEAIEAYISYNGVGVKDDARPEPPQRPTKQAKRSEAYYMGLRSALSSARRRQASEPEHTDRPQ